MRVVLDGSIQNWRGERPEVSNRIDRDFVDAKCFHVLDIGLHRLLLGSYHIVTAWFADI